MLATLLILGFSHKGTYGKIPVTLKTQASLELDSAVFHDPHVNSLIIDSEDKTAGALIVLVAYDQGLTELIRTRLQSNLLPLVVSVSALPFCDCSFDPAQLWFRQGSEIWQPGFGKGGDDIIPMGTDHRFGGRIEDGKVDNAILLLPAGFDPSKPITVGYGAHRRITTFR
ncbi:MAG: hypothetical protein D6743_09945 [Calditrichaeota bacterium]|nr:MAG: hypothetical protein D6743_09945 [Calditrichota bacterium]